MERPQIAALVMSSNPTPSVKLLSSGAEPLAPIAGKSVLGWVVDALLGASVRRVAIVEHEQTAAIRGELAARADRAMIELVTPSRLLADSVAIALERLGPAITMSESAHLLIVPAEAPQIETAELRQLIDRHVNSRSAATLLRGEPAEISDDGDPVVVRDATGKVTSILEQAVSEPGVLCINASMLVPALRRLRTPSWMQTIPLDDVVHILDEMGHNVDVLRRDEPLRTISSTATRTPIQMALHDRVIAGWLDRGTSIPDPRQVTIDATASLGQGVKVLPGSVIEGTTVVGDGAVIGPNTHLINALVGTSAHVPHSVVEDAEISPRERVRPFSVFGPQGPS